jgi:hypothetical protein
MLGLAILTGMILELWERMDYHDGGVTWVPQKTVNLGKLLQLGSWREKPMIRGWDEDNNVIVVYTEDSGVFMVQLESMWFKHVDKRTYVNYYPYANFYMTGNV